MDKGTKHSDDTVARMRSRRASEDAKRHLKEAWHSQKRLAGISARAERDAQIVAEFSAGASRVELAARYTCSNDNISRICRAAGIWREALKGEAKHQSKLKSKRNYRRAHPDRVSAQLKRWHQANVERVKERRRKWLRENRDKVRMSSSAYQARRMALLRAAPSDSQQEVRAYFSFIKNTKVLMCYWCGKRVPKKDRQVDHIIPVTKGGGTIIANLCCACGSCNRKKSGAMPEMFSGQYEIRF